MLFRSAYLDGKEIVTIGAGRNLEGNGLSAEEFKMLADPEQALFELDGKSGRYLLPKKNRQAAISSLEISKEMGSLMLANDLKANAAKVKDYDKLTDGAKAIIQSGIHHVGNQFTNMTKALKTGNIPVAIAELLLSKRSTQINKTRAYKELRALAGQDADEILRTAAILYGHGSKLKSPTKEEFLKQAARLLGDRVEPYVYK